MVRISEVVGLSFDKIVIEFGALGKMHLIAILAMAHVVGYLELYFKPTHPNQFCAGYSDERP